MAIYIRKNTSLKKEDILVNYKKTKIGFVYSNYKGKRLITHIAVEESKEVKLS